MEWYDWRNVCESLVTFGWAIQGVYGIMRSFTRCIR